MVAHSFVLTESDTDPGSYQNSIFTVNNFQINVHKYVKK